MAGASTDLEQVAQHFLRALWKLLQGTQVSAPNPSAFVPKEYIASLTGTAAIIISGNPQRRALVLSNGQSNPINIGTTAAGASNSGIIISQNAAPTILTYKDIGRVVCGEWWGLAPALSGSLFVLEIIEQPFAPEQS